MTINFRILGSLTVSILALAAVEAAAQDGLAPVGQVEAVAADAEPAGREIVVTAQKRAQSTQDVGIAINVLSGEKLENMRVETTEDLANYVPNLNVRKTKGENYPTITIRGVGLASGDVNYATSTSSTAVHVDEVYFGSPTMMGFALFDIDRVEVLKGPQGTLYGRNSTAGSINYLTRRPTREAEGKASLDWSDQNVVTLGGHVSGPLSDTLSARFAFNYEKGDSYQRDLNGRRWDGPDRLSTRTSLQFEPSDSFKLLATLTTGNDNSGIGRNHLRGISDNPWVADGNVFGDYNIDFIGGTLRGEYNLSDAVSLTSVTSYNSVTAILPDEADGEAIVLQEGEFRDKVRQFSQEVRLAGEAPRFNWIVGAYFFNEKIRMERDVDFFKDLYPPDDFTPGLVYNSNQRTNAYALFGQAEYDLTDKLSLLLGLRYSYERKNFRVTNLFNNFIGGVLGATEIDPATGYFFRNFNERDAEGWGDVSGRFGINYNVTDHTLLYASFSTGFKSGGYLGSVTITRDAVHNPGDPEDLVAYEAGIKTFAFDRKLRFDLAGFYYDYKDLQVESIVFQGIVPFQTLVNVQKVVVKGIDLDMSLYPADGLELNVGVGYVDGEHKRFTTGDGDFSGSRILNAPKWSVNSTLLWDFAEALDGTFSLMANHSYNSSIDFNFRDRTLGSGGYHLFDGRLAYTHEATGIEAHVGVKNLGNERVLVHAFERGDGQISELYLPPRRVSFGVSIPF